MQNSLASSPILPLGTAAVAALLIAGTFTNGTIPGSDDNASLASSSTPAAPDPSAAAPAPAPAPAPATQTAASPSATIADGKTGKVGSVSVTIVKATAKNAEVKIGKDSGTIADGKSGKIGKHTVTITKIDKKDAVTLSVK